MGKESLINEEVVRLTNIFSNMDGDKRKTAESLIENAAFMRITLADLQKDINKNGVTEEYQNGANQSGIKKSAAVEVYNVMIKNYMQVMRQIAELLPKGSLDDEDGFEAFANRRY